ncbi:MAG: hypothetical protein R3330_08295 [Saprospiraceae bacterium]|nr:hypothetical protein [Saprospiraceae bacterium]
MKYVIALCLSLSLVYNSASQDSDVASVDAIITALYDVISGPAGERDWDRFRSFFKENAIMGAMAPTREGGLVYRAMTPESYLQNNGPYFLENGFWETEIGREVHQFGELAHVFTTYQFVLGDDPKGPVARRGINSVQLVFEQDRWWIVSIQWNSEREDNPLPADRINK